MTRIVTVRHWYNSKDQQLPSQQLFEEVTNQRWYKQREWWSFFRSEQDQYVPCLSIYYFVSPWIILTFILILRKKEISTKNIIKGPSCGNILAENRNPLSSSQDAQSIQIHKRWLISTSAYAFLPWKYFTFLWSVRHSNLFVENNERVLSQEWVYLWISISLNLKSLQSLPSPVVYQSVLWASDSNFEMVANMIYNQGICLLKAQLIGALQGSFAHILPLSTVQLVP